MATDKKPWYGDPDPTPTELKGQFGEELLETLKQTREVLEEFTKILSATMPRTASLSADILDKSAEVIRRAEMRFGAANWGKSQGERHGN